MEYLEPRHGWLDGLEDWTPALRESVTRYLLREISDEDFAVFLEKLECDAPEGSRQEQVDFVIGHNQFWNVQWAVHMAVLDAAPDLASLISVMDPYHINYEEICDWLRRNAPYEHRIALFQQFDPGETPPEDDSDWWTFEYEYWLHDRVRGHKKLLRAWEAITRPGSSAPPRATDAGAIREWAKLQGIQIESRGRLSNTLVQKYLAGREI